MSLPMDGMASRCTPARDFRGFSILGYHMYRDYFPLLALATFKKASRSGGCGVTKAAALAVRYV